MLFLKSSGNGCCHGFGIFGFQTPSEFGAIEALKNVLHIWSQYPAQCVFNPRCCHVDELALQALRTLAVVLSLVALGVGVAFRVRVTGTALAVHKKLLRWGPRNGDTQGSQEHELVEDLIPGRARARVRYLTNWVREGLGQISLC